jgi:hypothetical protein
LLAEGAEARVTRVPVQGHEPATGEQHLAAAWKLLAGDDGGDESLQDVAGRKCADRPDGHHSSRCQ